jgi:hypothetical protein
MLVTKHGVWTDNWIYLMLITTNDYNSLTNLYSL